MVDAIPRNEPSREHKAQIVYLMRFFFEKKTQVRSCLMQEGARTVGRGQINDGAVCVN